MTHSPRFDRLSRRLSVGSRETSGAVWCRGVAIAMAMALCTAGLAAATPILDQSFDSGGGVAGLAQLNSTQRAAQTFTVGLAGQLVQADFFLTQITTGSFPDLQVDVYGTDGSGLPTGSSLSTATIPAASVPQGLINYGWVAVTLSTPLSVTVGEHLALVLSTTATTPSDYRWGKYGPVPTYAAGAPYDSVSNGPWVFSGNTVESPRDLQFRTYVDPVPEPASLALLGTGLFGIAMRRTWKRRGNRE